MNERHQATIARIGAAVASSGPPEETLQRALQLVHDRHPEYEWVGVYVLRGDALELGPYAGAPTEHTRIPVGQGVCGTAVAERANQVIPDVLLLDNYLACSATVRSEIVVLIWDGGGIIGQIDADCDEVGAFDGDDEAFLTEIAAVLLPLVRELTA